MKSAQIETLIDRFDENYDDELVNKRHECYVRVFNEHIHKSAAQQTARAFEAFLLEKNIRVRSYDLLGGHTQYLDTSSSNPIAITAAFDPRKNNGFPFDVPREIELFKRYRKIPSREELETLEYFKRGIECGLLQRWANGHVVAGFPNVVREGFGALEARINSCLAGASSGERDYLEAMFIAVRGARAYIRRYAQCAYETRAKTENAKERTALERIEKACLSIESKGASSFFEAVQLTWLLHEMLTFETYSGSMSFGRLDQLLYPYYLRDVENGVLTREDALELIEALWIKMASLVRGFQNVTVGGIDEQGNDASNDVTLMCIQASRALGLDQPLLSLRYHKGLGQDCWKEAQALIERGGGFPALFNDEVIIAALRKKGVLEEDAWNYGIIGCVEPTIGGKEYSNTEELRVNWAKIIELMLNGGYCTKTGIEIGLSRTMSLDKIQSFDDFYAWFKEELQYAVKKGMDACNLLDESYPHFFPAPLLSATIEDCIPKASDVAAMGAVYRYSSVNICGMSNAVDSLLAIQKAVFKEKRLSLTELAGVLRRDFTGEEALYAYLREHCPKYGNDREAPDGMMSELVTLFCDTVTRTKNCRGAHFQAGLYTVDHHAAMGKKTGALPEGRKSGVALANGASPVQGMDRSGPTATMNSTTGYNHDQASNGFVLDLKFDPSFFKTPSHKAQLRHMLDVYFDSGGMEAQINVVSRETLLAAQKEPSKYKNLLVRVSGFSAYFVTLDRVLQDEIIERTVQK